MRILENLRTNCQRTNPRLYILEKRRLGSDFCDYCDEEFKLGSEKDRKEKDIHIRDNHTFECNVCELRLKNREDLKLHLLTCEMYICFLCNYRHKRMSELKSHCKTKYSRNTSIKHSKMDRENFSKLSFSNHFSEEIWKKSIQVKWVICWAKIPGKDPR